MRQRRRNRQVHKLLVEVMRIINVILVTVPFCVCWYAYYIDRLAMTYYRRGYMAVVLVFVFLYVILGRTYQAFRISLSRTSEIIYSQFLAETFSDIIMYVFIVLLSRHFRAVWPLLIVLAVQLLISVVWCRVAQDIYFRNTKPLPTVVVWDMRESLDDLVDAFGMKKRFEVIGQMHVDECLKDIPESLRYADAVFLCGIHSHERNQIIKYCIKEDIRSYVIPRIGDVIMSGAESIYLSHLPVLMLERYNPSPFYSFVKRLFDVLISAVALVVLSPVFLVVSILIKKDGGTVFYRQTRLTKDGRKFDVLKFRSMRMDAEKDGVARLSTGDKDDRITPVGRVIRSCRIDELPQLVNILKGDMSIVGPRPERPEIAEKYEQEMPEFSLRLQVKAGLTGSAQVYGKYNSTPYDKLLMDLQYIARASIIEDLKIIFATVKILFLPESTEGIEEGATTAMGRKADNNFDGENTYEESDNLRDI